MRPVALSRKNWLFADSNRGGKTAAVMLILRNGHVITYRFIISLSKPSLNEPQLEKHSHIL